MRVFVGSRTSRERNARGIGLSAYEVDRTWTRWRHLQTLEMVNPSFLLADGATDRLYAVHGDLSEVSSLATDPMGRMTLLNQQAVQGRNPVHLELSADRTRLVVVNYATGSLSALPIRADGSLAKIDSNLPLHGVPGPLEAEQNGSHPHQALRWPGTDLFIVPNKGLDRVHVVRLRHDGSLALVHEAVAGPGSGPRHAAFDVETRRAWVANELDSTVTAYRFDPATGALEADDVQSLLSMDAARESRAAGIAHGAGHLYVSNRGHDSVTVMEVDRSTGAMTRRQVASTLGRTPRFLTLTPDRSTLLVANEGSDSIVRYRIGSDGLLADGRIVLKTGSPVCIVYMA